MRVAGRKDQRAQGWQIEPERKFPLQDTALGTTAAARDDLDTARAPIMGAVQKRNDRMMCARCRHAVQIELLFCAHFAAFEFEPAGPIEPGRRRVDRDMRADDPPLG